MIIMAKLVVQLAADLQGDPPSDGNRRPVGRAGHQGGPRGDHRERPWQRALGELGQPGASGGMEREFGAVGVDQDIRVNRDHGVATGTSWRGAPGRDPSWSGW